MIRELRMRVSKSTVLCILLFLTCLAGAFSLEGYVLAAENRNLALYYRDATGELAVVNRKNGYVWYSNPDYDEEQKISTSYRSLLESQIIIEYISDKNPIIEASYANRKTERLYSSIDSLEKGGLTISKKDAGIRIFYDFPEHDFSLPVYYTLTQSYLQVRVALDEMIDAADWTLMVENPATLEDIELSGDNKIVTIEVLPAFGLGFPDESGYIFVPDGAGALIDFNNGRGLLGPYRQNIYGNDEGMLGSDVRDKEIGNTLPIFGIHRKQNTLMVLVDDSAAASIIKANSSSRVFPFNYAYSTIVLREHAFYGRQGGNLLSGRTTQYNSYSLKYFFLEGEQQGYPGMAEAFRNYLIAEKNMNFRTEAAPLYLDLYGSVEKQRFILGIPVKRRLRLTGYGDVQTILERLEEQDVSNIAIRYTGRVRDKIPKKFTHDRILGSRKDYRNLIEYCSENDVELFFNNDFVNLHEGGHGFSYITDGIRRYNQKPAYRYSYVLSTNQPIESSRWKILRQPLVSDAVERFAGSAAEKQIKGLSFQSLGNTVYSDFWKNGVRAGETIKMWEDSLTGVRSDGISIMLSNAFAHAFPYADHILEGGAVHNDFDIVDRTIPFYQMVIHGSVNYSTQPVNLSSDPVRVLLQAAGTGAGLLFSWISADTGILEDTTLKRLYSADYRHWLETAVDFQKRLDPVSRKTAGARLIDYRELREQLFESTFSNGIKVLVNYSDQPAAVDGHTIGAKDFILLEGNE